MDGDGPLPSFTARLPAGVPRLTEAEADAYGTWWRRRAGELLPAAHSMKPWLFGSALALAGAGLCVRLDVAEVRDGGLVTVLLLGAYIAGAYVAGWRSNRYLRRWNRARHDHPDAVSEEIRFVLDVDGVSIATDTGRSWTAWARFREAHVAGGVLLLRIGRAEDAVAIPLRAFADPAAAAAYAASKVTLPVAGHGGYKG